VNPSAYLNTFTGIFAIAMVFAVPIISVITVLAIVLAVVNRRHKERMKMIEQGMMPPPPRKQKGNHNGLLITGAIFFAFGLALVAGELASRGNDFKGGFIFAFIGLAMLACFAIIRAARKNEPADNTDSFQPPPPPLPPKP
jgi:drug/metabolite transporter (DMT)-like permease